MKRKLIILSILSAMLLSGCQVENIHTNADVTDTPATTQEIQGTTEAATSETVTSETTAEEITTEETTVASTASSEAAQTPTLPPATEAEEEAATTAEESVRDEVTEEEVEEVEDEEIIEEEAPDWKAVGYTSDGEEFDIDPDYAYFLVNKEIRLPDDYSIETDTVQGDYVMETTAAYFCRLMIEAAKEDGIELKVLSAYRTVKYQERLFERNIESRMEDGMTYDEAYADVSVNIAPPGGSEHNAGLAVDIITKKDWDTYTGFEDTKEFAWLVENGPDYGYILRYLKGKEDITGYIYEPWHFRYIGIKYARDIMDSGLCLEEYFALQSDQ